jgi:RNA polymerase sigma factor (sigma-70 family)
MTTRMSKVIQHLRSGCLLPEGADLTDGQLLERFVSRRETAALEVLVRRHGPMVWGVCRRILSNHHDAEDALQATFLVLARKAASVRPSSMVGNWLYGVARQTALKARATVAKRRTRERQVVDMPDPAVKEQDFSGDLQALLDQELSRLPDKYRVAIVLCDLEGETRKQVARQLGLPEGTLAGRLTRGRAMLAKRLARHGLAVTGGALAALLSQTAASACVPNSALSSTIKALTMVAAGKTAAAGLVSAKVAALTEGVVKAMLLNKLKIVAVLVLTLCLLGSGTTVVTYHALAAAQKEATKEPAPKPQTKVPDAPAAKPKEDKELHQGTWHVVEVKVGGKHQAKETSKDQILVFTPDKFVIEYDDGSSQEMMYQIDAKQTPKAIDLAPISGPDRGYTFKGIYEIEGGRLKLYYSRNVAPDAKRPARFEPESEDRGMRSFVLKRAPAAKAPDSPTPKPKEDKGAFTAWGKEVGGLQTGLGYLPGQKRAYRHGETVKVVVRVRNAGKEAVDFKYIWAFFIENPPRITDADGKMVQLPNYRTRAEGLHAPRSIKVAPGKEVELYEWTFDLQPNGENSSRSFIHGTGKFSLCCERVVGPTWLNPNHPNPALSKLATGNLELEIKMALPKQDK